MSDDSPHITFEYWTDPLCVWAFVAQPRYDQLLESHGALLAPRQRVVPVFGSFSARFAPGGAWAEDGPEGRAEKTRKLAVQFGREDVTGAVWMDDCPASSWPAGLAIKAVSALADDGAIPRAQLAAYIVALRERFFVRNRNTARREEQLSVAEELSIPRAAIERHLDDGTAVAALLEDQDRRLALGLRGSPSYVFDDGRAILYGNFSQAVLNATVEQLVQGLIVGGSDC